MFPTSFLPRIRDKRRTWRRATSCDGISVNLLTNNTMDRQCYDSLHEGAGKCDLVNGFIVLTPTTTCALLIQSRTCFAMDKEQKSWVLC